MIIRVTRIDEKNRSYFDKKIIFQSTKDIYVMDKLSINAIYDVKQHADGTYESPSKINKIK